MPATSTSSLRSTRLGEAAHVARHNAKGVTAAYDILAIISLEFRFDLDDRQSVDGDAGGHRGIARLGNRPAVVVGAVAGDVDRPVARP